MIKVKCAYCGAIFYAPTVRRVYCSDSCRRKAYRQKESSKGAAPKPAGTGSRPLLRSVSANDPAQKMMEAMRKYGKFSYEWWEAFREYEVTCWGGAMTVNGVSVKDPDFAEIMVLMDTGKYHGYLHKAEIDP